MLNRLTFKRLHLPEFGSPIVPHWNIHHQTAFTHLSHCWNIECKIKWQRIQCAITNTHSSATQPRTGFNWHLTWVTQWQSTCCNLSGLARPLLTLVSLRPLPLAHSLPSSISCSQPAVRWAVIPVWLLWHWLAAWKMRLCLYSIAYRR